MNNSLGIDEKKFLSSSKFIDLPLENGETINSFSNIIIEDSSRIFLISGQPGSGKSQMMKKIFFNLSGSELELRKQVRYIIKNKILPIIIDLKSCQDDNLYRIIKEKLGDYSICLVKSEFSIIYILDGLDEITLERANKICVDLKNCQVILRHLKY
ncbi:DUF2075 domain-containing protein [Clostridium botulinum]|nr:DUF2075 domain-containing protein [Clostridium botulinum]